jgi:FlaA1/EpsC-like NDP-sugar epimerase
MQEKTMCIRSLITHRENQKMLMRRAGALLLDCTAFVLAGQLAFGLRFDLAIPAGFLRPMWIAICVWAVTKPVVFLLAKLLRGGWQYTSTYDAVRIVVANTVGSALSLLAILVLLGPTGIPRSIYILDCLIACLLTLGLRFATRVILSSRWWNPAKGVQTRTLIYGAGAAGLALLWELRQNQALQMQVVGLIDDDLSKAHLILQGKRVLGTGEDLADVVRAHRVKRVLIAAPSASGAAMVRMLKFALDAGVEYKMVPGLGDLVQGKDLGKQIRDVAVEDLLGRRPVELDQDSIRDRIQGKVVMVTGAAGSIGSELCRQIARFRPMALVGYDAAETPLFHIERELTQDFPGLVFHAEIGDVTRPESLHWVMQKYQPSILYHAAAYKHVPMMERHVFSAIENNVFGTWQVALAAARHGVEDFVLISTDKAVRPTSMMGATKRAAEIAIRALQRERGTKFVAVRFGNVLGSNGSVVPIFKEQIAAGGPLTVTHPDMSRYFMTIPEAAQLVLQAFSFGKGGEVFVLDMGEPVKIVNLARNLILLSGLQPERDIKIEFTGLRPGEKLYEELNLDDERLVPTRHDQIKSYQCPAGIDTKQVKAHLQELRSIVDERDVAELVLLMKKMIPDYNPGSELLKAALTSKGRRGTGLEAEPPADGHGGDFLGNLPAGTRLN